MGRHLLIKLRLDDVLDKVLVVITNNVTERSVRASIQFVTLTKVITGLDTTANLGSRLPDNSSEMASVSSETRIAVVVVLDFTVPAIDGSCPGRIAQGQVLAIRAGTVLELALVAPLLSISS